MKKIPFQNTFISDTAQSNFPNEYKTRHGDNFCLPVTIEYRVYVNRCMNIYSQKPLDFGDKDYIEIPLEIAEQLISEDI